MRPLACVALLALAFPARADIFIHVPFVTVRIAHMAPPGMPGPTAVSVRAPFVNLNFASRPSLPVVRPPAPRPVTVPVIPVPGEETAPAPRPVTPAPTPPPTGIPSVAAFASSFRPVPGNYEVVLRHPLTGTPVTVKFTLPPGTPRKVKVFKRRLVFDYGRRSVVLRFFRDGSVRVRY